MDEIEKRQPSRARTLAVNPAGEPLQYFEGVEVLPEEPPHLLDYLETVLKRRWVVWSCLLIVFGTTAIGTFKQKPVYRATALVEINPAPPDVLNLKDVLQVAANMDVETYRATQMEVLRSRSLAERVVQNLHLYNYPEFVSGGTLWNLLRRAPAPSSPVDDRPPDTSSDIYRTTVQQFLDSLSVKQRLHTSLVEVSFDSTDPKLATKVTNQLAEEYIKENLEAKFDETVKASDWLSEHLGELKAKLEKSEDVLQAYAQAHSIVFVSEKQDLGNARLQQLQEEYTKAEADRLEKEALAKLVQTGKVEALPGFVSDKVIQDLQARLMDLQREYARITASARPEYPKAVQTQKQIESVQASLENMKKLIGQNAVHEYEAALQHEKALGQALEQQKKEVNEVAASSIQYNILKREADSNRQLYDTLLQRLKESQLQAGLKATNIRIVDPAEIPKRPFKPRVILNLGLGVLLGLMAGIGLAFFLEYMDKTVKTPDDIEKRLHLPSLGILPKFVLDGAGKGPGTKLVPVQAKTSPLQPAGIQTTPATQEAFRNLRTSILLSADPVPKLILITSALPSEGKTTVTLNLGATLASLGSSVVVVDCDMRRPSCHRQAGVENKPGFVRCLTGQVDLKEAILPVPGIENLSVIPCGPIPPNPAEVLSSPRTQELMEKLRSDFEYVLVDSPPLLSVTDGRILSTLTDGVVLVVHGFSTPYDVVRRARASLSGAGARILGVALNNVDLRRDGYTYNYYYRYGYGYGYGYGSDERGSRDAEGDDLPGEDGAA